MNYTKLFFLVLILVVFNLLLFRSNIIEYIDYKIYDVTNQIIHKDNKNLDSSVVIVNIDEKSLDYLGQWPWSRLVLANLINVINDANPSSIGLDIIFPEDDKTSPNQMMEFYKKYFSTEIKIEGLSKKYFDNDAIFAKSLLESQSVLSVYLNNENIKQSTCKIPKQVIDIKNSSNIEYEAKNILCNIEQLQQSSSGVGFINSTQDKDGIFRRVPLFVKYKDNIIPNLSLATMMSLDKVVVDKKDVSILGHSIKTGKYENVLLNFYDESWYKKVSAVDVLLGKIDKKVLQGKFILIGASATGLNDKYMISTGKIISGIDVHATLIDNILNEESKYQPENMKNINFLISTLILFILLIYMKNKKQIEIIVVFLVSSLLYSGVTIFMLLDNVYISLAYFLTPLVIGFFLISIILVITNYQEKKLFFNELAQAHSATIDIMALVVEIRDTETGAHIQRTKEYIDCLGEYLYKNNIYKDTLTKKFRALIYRASPLHDIGKVAIPDNILKKPGKLTHEEFEIMKEHPTLGKEILENALNVHKGNEFLQIALQIAYCHHEKWNGKGYPNGLKGSEIPLEARMMALADVYDALISRRVYKASFSFEDSAQIIVDGKGSHFDPVLVDAFVKVKSKFEDIATKIQ